MVAKRFFPSVWAVLLCQGSASPMPNAALLPTSTGQPHPAETTPAPILEQRQQQPFSVSNAIATAVDPSFYTVSGEETSFVGSDSSAFSSRTVTASTGGGTLTKASGVQVALHTGTVNGQEEISFFFAPELAEQIRQIVYDGSKTTETIPDSDVAKRGLPIPPPASIVRGIINLVGPEMAVGFLSEFTAVAGIGELAALGATAVGFAPLLGAAITIGGTAYAAVELIEYISNHVMAFKQLDRNTFGGFPKAIKVNKGDLKSQQDKCPKDIQCVDCGGINQVCTTNNAGCICKNKKECPKKDGDSTSKLPIDCADSKCKGNDQDLCTADDNKNCPCAHYGTGDVNVHQKDYAAAFQHFLDVFENGLKRPTGNMTCSKNSADYIETFYELPDGSRVKPDNIMFKMRETLCNNKCEIPPGLNPDTVRATPDGDGCEIAILSSNNNELYAYRQTAASGSQQQDCWDSLEHILNDCFQNGPNTGWVNGPDDFEFYQTGIRKQGSSDQQKHKDTINVISKGSFLVCSTCGGPKEGGKCSGSDGTYPNEICCPSFENGLKCDDKRCNSVGAKCTGDLNGCLCTFNGF